jgi:hypothetical protein
MATLEVGIGLTLSCIGSRVTCCQYGEMLGECDLSEDGILVFGEVRVCLSLASVEHLAGRTVEAVAEPEPETRPMTEAEQEAYASRNDSPEQGAAIATPEPEVVVAPVVEAAPVVTKKRR